MPAAGRSVVVTGLGPVTAAGIGVSSLVAGLRSCRSPVAEVTAFDATPFRSRMAAEVHDFDPLDFMDARAAKRVDRFVQLTLAATELALRDAELDAHDVDGTRAAVLMGSSMGGIAHAEVELRRFLEHGSPRIDPRLATTTFAGAASCHVAIAYGFMGHNATNAMSCAAGTIAVGEAARLIREGVADVAVAGGAEAPLAPVCYGAFASLRAMSTRNHAPAESCRPFDRGRDGFVMGEGACAVVLESAEHAAARGAKPYARVSGFGINNDAHHMSAPRPDASRAAACISAALAEGGLTATDVDHVNAHGSSTKLNDPTETTAIRAALGRHADRVAVTGTKPFHGHALGASGAIEVAVSCLTLRDGWVPPTLNLDEPGDGCDLDYVTGPGREGTYRAVLSNSFGFGGINAVLLLTAPSASP